MVWSPSSEEPPEKKLKYFVYTPVDLDRSICLLVFSESCPRDSFHRRTGIARRLHPICGQGNQPVCYLAWYTALHIIKLGIHCICHTRQTKKSTIQGRRMSSKDDYSRKTTTAKKRAAEAPRSLQRLISTTQLVELTADVLFILFLQRQKTSQPLGQHRTSSLACASRSSLDSLPTWSSALATRLRKTPAYRRCSEERENTSHFKGPTRTPSPF